MRLSPRLARLPQRLVQAVAVVCLLAYAALPLHDALVEHVVCAQHGEVVHAEEGGHGLASDPRAAPAPEGLGRAAPAAEAAHDADAHCGLGTARRHVPGPALVALPAPDLAAVRVPTAGVRDAARPLTALAVAPKASPPRG